MTTKAAEKATAKADETAKAKKGEIEPLEIGNCVIDEIEAKVNELVAAHNAAL